MQLPGSALICVSDGGFSGWSDSSGLRQTYDVTELSEDGAAFLFLSITVIAVQWFASSESSKSSKIILVHIHLGKRNAPQLYTDSHWKMLSVFYFIVYTLYNVYISNRAHLPVCTSRWKCCTIIKGHQASTDEFISFRNTKIAASYGNGVELNMPDCAHAFGNARAGNGNVFNSINCSPQNKSLNEDLLL